MAKNDTRKQKRAVERKQKRVKYSLMDVQRAINIALEMRRLTNGHLFTKNLKSRCVFCGVKTKGKKECNFWFLTFIDRLQVVLINPAYFKDDEIDAFWLMAENEYKQVQIPVNTKLEAKKDA